MAVSSRWRATTTTPRSTVTAQQSETLFVHIGMPVLNPATIQELPRSRPRRLGDLAVLPVLGGADLPERHRGLARRRSTSTPSGPHLVVPDVEQPPSLTMWRPPSELEVDIRERRFPAAQAFVRANGLDVVTLRSPRPRLGIITAGKAYLDVQDAMAGAGLTDEHAAELGISVYKVAMTWPIEPEGVLEFATDLQEVLVVEPKHPIIEDQVVRLLRRLPRDRRPEVVGKTDDLGAPLVPVTGGARRADRPGRPAGADRARDR